MSAVANIVRCEVKSRLSARGMTQAELALRSGVTQKHVSMVLKGHAFASPELLDRWARILMANWRVELVPW